MQLKNKDLVGLEGVSAEEIAHILDSAKSMKDYLKQGVKKMPQLQNKSIVTLFYENSTRTKMSFDLAGKYLGASMSAISASSSSIQKGETLLDTGRTLEAMGVDIVIMRHPMSGAPELLGRNIDARVINAGDGMHEHPTQALLDMYTMQEKLGKIKGLNVVIIGDILHSRVARSNIHGLQTMGANVTLCSPATLMPMEIEKTGVRVTYDLKNALKDADVVMGLRLQLERQKNGLLPSLREYNELFGVTRENIKYAKPGALIMHPGPVNRGVEMDTDIIDHDRSVITEQVTNGVAIRMALLYLMTRKKEETE
ncbi:MAG: aspartate carbamoyltransferase catalytic subunit [Eubacteriales bacterium]